MNLTRFIIHQNRIDMRVIFDYQKTRAGHKLEMVCEDIPQLESGAYDIEEYQDCFRAIRKHIENNHLDNFEVKII